MLESTLSDDGKTFLNSFSYNISEFSVLHLHVHETKKNKGNANFASETNPKGSLENPSQQKDIYVLCSQVVVQVNLTLVNN